uniref:Small ribosomal subunit protein uS3m n=1 Tax=Talaromyces stipitatus (strain ATCC 10500 / CBS 375.48 / QM 6759 / NRRL 1006) TaxID=441959 RepID=H9CNM2_TALSN|nr:ribosomal protein S5 [Talaromyces stipitatus]
MLNIIKSKLNTSYKKKRSNNKNVTISYKNFVPAIRDWKNSIYVYNKNTLSLIPVASNYIMKLIKGYFSLSNLKLEKKLRKEKLRRRSIKLSTNKIFLSDGEFKHTNDKVIITLYLYNRQKYNYLYKLKKRYVRLFVKTRFLEKLNLIKSKGLIILEKQRSLSQELKKILPSYKSKLSFFQHLYYKNFIKKALKRLKFYMFYKQLLYINQNKFNYSYLQGLINLIKKIFNKNVELNLINLKYFYFNSDIFSQPLVLKLRQKRNLLRYLKACVRKVKIKKTNETLNSYFFDLNKFNSVEHANILNNLFNEKYVNRFNSLLLNLLKQNEKIYSNNTAVKNKYDFNILKYIIFNNIKYKRVSGVRLEAAGRLTKRYTASRSRYKVIYKGNLENTLSSVKGDSSVVLRGNFKPNLQYTKLNSKSRIGSFGVKGWVSGE